MKRLPWTFWLGLAVILAAECFLAIDVRRRGGLVLGHDVAGVAALPQPTTTLGWIARSFAVNMTVVCWAGYLLVAEGVLAAQRPEANGQPLGRTSPIRARPHRFLVAWLTSIPVWCFFDWVNFYWMDAWRYHGLPPSFVHRGVGYFIAFAAIGPGMFLAAEFYMRWMRPREAARGQGARQDAARRQARRSLPLAWWLTLLPPGVIATVVLCLLPFQREMGGRLSSGQFMAGSALLLLGPPAAAGLAAWVWRRSVWVVAPGIGAGFTVWAFFAAAPIANLTLWVGLIYLLDPINARFSPATSRIAPSLLRDWQAGRWRRSVALALGGLTCGLLWEFWNYWALAKWTYHLPFLGVTLRVHYFEMPALGLGGFMPFAGECWVMLNLILLGLDRLGLHVADPLPDEYTIL